MNIEGKCRRLRIYIGEDSLYKGHNLYHALVEKMKDMDLAGVTVTRGIEGYGADKRLKSFHILDLSANLPVIVEAVDTVSKIEAAVPELKEMVEDGFITASDIEVIKYG